MTFGPLHRFAVTLSMVLLVALARGEPGRPVAPADPQPAGAREDGSVELADGRVVPALPRLLGMREQYEVRLGWLERRHALLLPMMRRHGVGMWIIMNHEFQADPATQYVAPPLQYVSRRDVHVLVDASGEGLVRYSNYGRPTADYARFFSPFPVPRSDGGLQDTAAGLRAIYDRYDTRKIALNMGGDRGQNGGLTYDGYRFLVEALGPGAERWFVSSRDLIEEYFDTRLPEELEHYRTLVLATDVLAQRALSNEVITPGRTRAVDVKWWFNEQIARLGVGATPWFEIHTAVQRFDPAAGQVIPYVHPAPDDLVFQRGDVVHLDTGFSYLGFASDWQKVAYILREGETDVTPGMKRALANANLVHEAMRRAPRPGMTGREATLAVMKLLDGVDFQPSLYSHAIGYHGHALGPSLTARDMQIGPPPERDSVLRLGSYRSIEFSATTRIPEWNDGPLVIPMEDDAHLTEQGYDYFRPVQDRWYLIR